MQFPFSEYAGPEPQSVDAILIFLGVVWIELAVCRILRRAPVIFFMRHELRGIAFLFAAQHGDDMIVLCRTPMLCRFVW